MEGQTFAGCHGDICIGIGVGISLDAGICVSIGIGISHNADIDGGFRTDIDVGLIVHHRITFHLAPAFHRRAVFPHSRFRSCLLS